MAFNRHQLAHPFIAYHPIYNLPLPDGHRFPMLKYELLPKQLLLENVVTESDFFEPEALDKKFLEGIHDPAYLSKIFNLDLNRKETLRMGFPLSQQLIDRELYIADGTIKASKIALAKGIGFNISGGTHHAGYNWAEGFCLLNDHAIAAGYLLREIGLKRILIIDLDVHQGNGTANIFQNEPRVFTFSMHGERNFPFIKEKSDLDIGLPDKITGKEYLPILKKNLEYLFQKVKPQFVFFQSGVDVLETDKMGRMKLTMDDCRHRDALVFEYCKKYQVPVEVSIGGGYSQQMRSIVNAHANTYKQGIQILG